VCVSVCMYVCARVCLMMAVLRDQVASAVPHVTNSQSTELEFSREESAAYPDLSACDHLNVSIVH
jgi:metal-sulfur cluster biosynthetic enzyme